MMGEGALFSMNTLARPDSCKVGTPFHYCLDPSQSTTVYLPHVSFSLVNMNHGNSIILIALKQRAIVFRHII